MTNFFPQKWEAIHSTRYLFEMSEPVIPDVGCGNILVGLVSLLPSLGIELKDTWHSE